MGFFNFFNQNNQPPEKPSLAAEELKQAEEKYEAGDYQAALQALEEGFHKDIENQELYKLATDCLNALGGQDEADLFRKALMAFENWEVFKEIGSHFYYTGHYYLARPFLHKALDMNPESVEAAHDLAVCYARRFQIEKAIEVLDKVNVAEYFWAYWFFARLMLLNATPDKALPYILEMEKYAAEYADDPNWTTAALKVKELREFHTRLGQLPNPNKESIREWHFVQYGGIILDLFDLAEDYVAGGRYVALMGTESSIKAIIIKLQKALEVLDLHVKRVVAMPNQQSEVIGRVIAKLLGLSFAPYAEGRSTEGCLVVAANTSDFNGMGEIAHTLPNQLLFALNHDWLAGSHMVPDIVGMMTQSFYWPWSPEDGRKVEYKIPNENEPDEPQAPRDIPTIVQAILETEPENKELDMSLYLTHKAYLQAGGTYRSEYRYNFMIESPVVGSFFGR